MAKKKDTITNIRNIINSGNAIVMNKYKSENGSGVTAFKIVEKGILVKFKDEYLYLYDYNKPGKEHVEKMIEFAYEGKGLATHKVNKQKFL